MPKLPILKPKEMARMLERAEALALIYVIIRKRRGKLLAVLSILFGLLGSLVLITFC